MVLVSNIDVTLILIMILNCYQKENIAVVMISKGFSDKSCNSTSFSRFALPGAYNFIPQMYCCKDSYNVVVPLVAVLWG